MAVNVKDTAIQIKTHIANVGTERGGFQAFLMTLPADVRFTQADVTAICEELDSIMPFPLGTHYWEALFQEVLYERIADGLPNAVAPRKQGLFSGLPAWGWIALGVGCVFLLHALGVFGGDGG